jgi:hypothetical protein
MTKKTLSSEKLPGMCSVFFKKSNKLNNLRQKTIDLNNGRQFGTCMAITEYATPKKYSLKRDTEGNFKSVIKINHLSPSPVFAGSVLLIF